MTRRGLIGVLTGLVSASALAGCGFFGGSSYNFKMTVEVETPEGVKTGPRFTTSRPANRFD